MMNAKLWWLGGWVRGDVFTGTWTKAHRTKAHWTEAHWTKASGKNRKCFTLLFGVAELFGLSIVLT